MAEGRNQTSHEESRRTWVPDSKTRIRIVQLRAVDREAIMPLTTSVILDRSHHYSPYYFIYEAGTIKATLLPTSQYSNRDQKR